MSLEAGSSGAVWALVMTSDSALGEMETLGRFEQRRGVIR